MIVLKRINASLVEKVINPGTTEKFFSIDLNKSEAFDWNVKTFMQSNGFRGINKISSLYNGSAIESNTYSFLGTKFNTNVDISVSADGFCVFSITNNEPSVIRCSVRLKTF